MRIVRLSLDPKVSRLLEALSKEQGIDDVGFAEDIFSLMRLKGNGLPDKGRILAMSHYISLKGKVSQIGVSLLMGKRKMILERLSQLPYFKALSRQTDLVNSVTRLLVTFRSFYYKVRQAQCVSCHLKLQCDFGKQYGSTMSDITKVIDSDYQTKVHSDCPVLPEISVINQMDQAVQSMIVLSGAQQAAMAAAAAKGGVPVLPLAAVQAMAAFDPDAAEDTETDDPDPDAFEDDYHPIRGAGAGKKSGYDNVHTGQHICKVTEQFVKDVSQQQLAIFEIGRKFSLALSRRKDINFKPVPHIEHDQTQAHIKSESEVTQLVSSQHGLPDEVFEARLNKKQLVKREYTKPEDKKQLLYFLIDSSASMGGQLGSNSKWSLFTRGSLSCVFALSMLRKIKEDNGIMFVRFFEGEPGPLHKAEKISDFDTLAIVINRNNFGGGGTDIHCAVATAIRDISKADSDSELAKSEIIMVTDCEDSINGAAMKASLGKIELNVLDVSGHSNAINKELKLAATKYFKANEGAPDINKIVDLV